MNYFFSLTLLFISLNTVYCEANNIDFLQAKDIRKISETLIEIRNELKEIRKEMKAAHKDDEQVSAITSEAKQTPNVN